jgi:hypothetical protein
MLTDITYNDLEFICMNMRERDKAEIYALRPHDNPLQLAMEAHAQIRNLGRGQVAWWKGKPAAALAFTEDWPGVWSIWMFGTDDFKNVAIELVRWARKEANEILKVCKGHRIHCDSKSDYEEAHKLIEAAGGKREFTMRRYGKDGEDFTRFIWLREEDSAILEPHFVRADKSAA